MSDAQATWSAVDAYLEGVLALGDDAIADGQRASHEGGLPPIAVSAAQGKLLHVLARATGARRILEVGTLGGFSGTWLARALPADGLLITLEIDAHHAEVARQNFERAGVAERVEVMVGEAIESLAELEAAGAEPFDMVFIDADKESYAAYFEASLRLSRPGTLIIADNVVRQGQVADPAITDSRVEGVRGLIEAMGADPRVTATVLQVVGAKGYDGIAVAVVLAAE